MGPPTSPWVLQHTCPGCGGQRSIPGLLNLILLFLKDNQRGVLVSQLTMPKEHREQSHNWKPYWAPALWGRGMLGITPLALFLLHALEWQGTEPAPFSSFRSCYRPPNSGPKVLKVASIACSNLSPACPWAGGLSCCFPTPWPGGSLGTAVSGGRGERNLEFAVGHPMILWPACQASLGAGMIWQWEKKTEDLWV